MTNAAVIGSDWGIQAMHQSGIDFLALEAPIYGLVYPRYVFVLGWSERIPAAFWQPYEVINFHCTKLPFGRGGHPIENLIRLGHTETVITAHRVTGELDAGPVYGVSDHVSLAGSKADILARFVDPCARLIQRIAKEQPKPKAQRGTVTRFRRLTPEAYRQFWADRA